MTALRPIGQHDAEVSEDTLLHRNVLESMREGVLTVTADGRVGILNPAASRLLGLDGDEVRGKPIGQVLMDRNDLEAFNDVVLAAVYDEAVGSRTAIGLRLGDGTERSVTVTTSYLVSREGGENRRIGLVAVLDDVTEVEALRETEREMAEATAAQNVELREAYREIEDKNKALDSALKKMTAVRALAMLLVVVLFAGAAWYVWDDAGTALTLGTAAPPSQTSSGARTLTVAPRRLVSTVSFVGRLAPRREVPVTNRVSGKVARVLFEYGDRVEAGQPLVELDTAETRRRYLEAQAGYLDARDKLRDLENWENSREIARARQSLTLAGMELEARKAKLTETALLLERGVIPASEHKAAEQRYEGQRLRYAAAERDMEAARDKADADAVRIARLRLENAETRMRRLEKTLEDAVVRAPVSGVVLQPGGGKGRAEVGRRRRRGPAGGGAVGERRRLSAEHRRSERAYRRRRDRRGGCREGEAGPAGQDRRRRFPPTSCSREGSRGSRRSPGRRRARACPCSTLPAAVDDLADEHFARLRLGMSANVTVVTRDEPAALLVPLSAVRGGRGNYRVRLKDRDGGAVRDVPVEVGQTTVHEVEITGGLKPGDEVIVSGS